MATLNRLSEPEGVPAMRPDPDSTTTRNSKPRTAVAQQRFAIRLSLAIGVLMLVGKSYAYFITSSTAILSDAAESVIHVVAVAFAAYSLWLSLRPADDDHLYGHDKIGFFSAGVEGMLIVLAAVYIIYEAVSRWITGLRIENIGRGTLVVAAAALLNLFLGLYLVRQGKRHRSIVLVANGKHVLTDSWTSLGVIVGLLLVLWTGWLPFDPILAILIAINILWSGGKLVRESVGGLMDEGDPQLNRELVEVLDSETRRRGLRYHELRHRYSGTRVWIDFHLLFPEETTVDVAHRQATEIEAVIESRLSAPVTITTHLESMEQHHEVHRKLKNSTE
jgi:cation diffusion facilitator family transporter